MLFLTSTGSRLGRAAATLLLALSLVGFAPVAAQPLAHEIAIQDVIQRGNAAQIQALATRDPTFMAETAHSGYYQQLVRTNQNLSAQGVTVIELVDLEWGPITVTSNTATATTFETWRTSYADGPTEFSRDRNVYSLVQDADGAWKVAANEHPDGRARRALPPPPEPLPTPAVPAQPGTGTSRNWSGYAARGGTFTSVSASWTVPQLALDGPFGADATWVGIGGLRTRDLIQAGTQQLVSGTGTVTYQAWIETLPDPSRPVPLTVLPGHSVNVSVDQQAGDTWLFSFMNLTTGQTLQRTVQYTSSLSSAEWIEEAPYARRRVLPISQFGSLTFTSASAVKDGQSLTIADLEARPISLVDDSGRVLAVPSPLGPDGASFTISRI
jgi:Peptidase A4 family